MAIFTILFRPEQKLVKHLLFKSNFTELHVGVSLFDGFCPSQVLELAHQRDNEVKHEDLEHATGQYKDDPSVVLVVASVKVANCNSVHVLQHCPEVSCFASNLNEGISLIEHREDSGECKYHEQKDTYESKHSSENDSDRLQEISEGLKDAQVLDAGVPRCQHYQGIHKFMVVVLCNH